MSTGSLADETSICVGCGLCCDGTLHGSATVKSGDEQNVVAAGLEIIDGGNRRFFRQPCPHSCNGSCSIYAARPNVCRGYQCSLLQRVESGEISQPEARGRISTAKKLLAAVLKLDPSAVTPSQRSALNTKLKESLSRTAGEAERNEISRAVLDIAQLEYFLNRWFLKEDKNRGEAGAPDAP
jgi:hypothetical protein